MRSLSYHWVITVPLLFGLFWVRPSLAFNDDKPIYKWSPRWFNGFADRYQSKRYNEDKPIYKWHPIWFYRNSIGKRVTPIDECIPEFGRCFAGDKCCPGMECYGIDFPATPAVCVSRFGFEVSERDRNDGR